MNIKRLFDKNYKLLIYIVLSILFIILIISSLNTYYKTQEKEKENNFQEDTQKVPVEGNNVTLDNIQNSENNGTTTVKDTMKLFVNYCNNREISKAYAMLTEDCKKALYYTTEELFEKYYLDIRFDEQQEYSMVKWSSEGNRELYLVKFFGNILATGGESGISQEYYTFIKENGNYKININNFIYSQDKNIEYKKDNITVQIMHVDVFADYENVKYNIINNTKNTISMTGKLYSQNVYMKNSQGVVYSSMNSKFDTKEVLIKSGENDYGVIKFNKTYSITNKATEIIFDNIILNYEEYQKAEDKSKYPNKTSIEIRYN